MNKSSTINPDHIILIERCISGYHKLREMENAGPGSAHFNQGQVYSRLYRDKPPSLLDLSELELNDDEFIHMLPKIAKLKQVTKLYLTGNEITGLSIQ